MYPSDVKSPRPSSVTPSHHVAGNYVSNPQQYPPHSVPATPRAHHSAAAQSHLQHGGWHTSGPHRGHSDTYVFLLVALLLWLTDRPCSKSAGLADSVSHASHRRTPGPTTSPYGPAGSLVGHPVHPIPPPPTPDRYPPAVDQLKPTHQPKRRSSPSAFVPARETYASGARIAGNPPNGVEQCAECETKTSPEWRKGPSGKKDLCNA
jgi:hypothetical protein